MIWLLLSSANLLAINIDVLKNRCQLLLIILAELLGNFCESLQPFSQLPLLLLQLSCLTK
jgi:hypothetical protein